MADRLHRRLGLNLLHRMRPVGEHEIRIIRQKPDQLLTAWLLQIGLFERALAEEVRLLLGNEA